MKIRRRVYEILEVAGPQDRASQLTDYLLLTLIALNIILVVVETVPGLSPAALELMWAFEVFSLAVFSVEYLLRLWSCTADPDYAGALRGRLRFAATPMAVIDLLAIAPAILTFTGVDLRFLRALRLFRILRVAKLVRYSRALRAFGRVLAKRRGELVTTFVILGLLLLVSSCLMYLAEHEAQPEVFSSIPAAMWWAVATLSTVGYGDIYPITALGRLLASFVAVIGIGMFAVPAGILGAAFAEEIEGQPAAPPPPTHCPHCGEQLQAPPRSSPQEAI